MTEQVVFLVGTLFFVWLSWRSLFKPLSHGFYRFFAFESILALVVLNFHVWMVNLLSPHQLVSWSLLLISVVFVSQGVYLLNTVGRPNEDRKDKELLHFERTSRLVTSGIFRYIRHPMYSSLLFLAWGAFLKDISLIGMVFASLASITLLLTSLRDEAECSQYFGEEYIEYMATSKRFVPFIF